MSRLYPLLMLPEFSERPWGTRDLSFLYPHKTARQGGEFEKPIGESWLTGDACRVANGDLAGQTLADVSKRFGRELLGDAPPDEKNFPLLLKFLFPKDKLSVQVHPDDEMAHRLGQPFGKNECWYVLAAEPGAQVALGFHSGTTREEIEAAIRAHRLEALLNWINLRPGEMLYADAGTVHAIGPGSILVETQQSSDATFRLYDYGRGRELHVAQGMEAMKLKTHAGKVQRRMEDGRVNLVTSPFFVVDKLVVKEPMDVPPLSGKSSVQVLVGLDGCGVIEADGMRPVTLAKGEAVIVPAMMKQYRIRPQWALECLRSYLPGSVVEYPATSLE